jgi:hypothetical protein
MTLHIIKNQQLKRLNPPDGAALAQLRGRALGLRDGAPITAGDLLDEGQPFCLDGEWIVPELLTIDDGNSLRREDSSSLEFATGVDETTANPVAYFEARLGGQLVHRSASPHLRKGVTIVKEQSATAIHTKYGPMLMSDLDCRVSDERVEYWMRLQPAQVNDGVRDVLRRYNPEQLQERTTPTGVEHWELVHASAIPRGKPQ